MSSPAKVLHVDDEPNFGDLVTTFLERESDRIEVLSETNAQDGLETLEREDIECVVSDYDMPKTDGLEFLEGVRHRNPNIPFILFTGKGSEEIASEAISAGVTDYMQKGGGTDQYTVLANRVRNAIRQYRSEKEAEQVQRRLREVTESSTDCIWMFTRDWDELLFISGYEEVWGRSVENIRENPQDFLQGVHPADREFVQDAMETLSSGESIDIEYRIQKDEDETGWVWVKGKPIFDDGGTVVRVVGLTRDITERKQREQELRRNERRFEAMFNDPNILVGLLEPDGTVLDVNDTALEYISANRQELQGELLSETPWFTGDKALQQDVRQWVARARDGEYVDFEANLTEAVGEPLSVSGVFRPVVDETGNVVSILISDQDVTEQKVREQQLAAILENTTTPMFLKDRQGAYVLVNQAFRDLFDLRGETVIGKTDEELFPEEMAEEVNTNDQTVLEQAESIETEERVLVNGSERIYLSSKVPVYDIGIEADPAEPVAVFGVANDITDRKQRERELERQNEQFDELAGIISHDFQTPIETVRGRLELAQRTNDQDQIEEALDALQRVDELREGIVNMLRSREIVGDTERLDVAETAASAWESVTIQGDATLDVVESARIEADPDALRRLLQNLLSNSVEHGSANVTIRVGKTANGFYVEDDGPGIPEEHRQEVFTPGFTTKSGGNGMGMASVRQIVDSHGWQMKISSSESLGGVRFEVVTETE